MVIQGSGCRAMGKGEFVDESVQLFCRDTWLNMFRDHVQRFCGQLPDRSQVFEVFTVVKNNPTRIITHVCRPILNLLQVGTKCDCPALTARQGREFFSLASDDQPCDGSPHDAH